jgi:hypothetical protein
MSLGAADKVFLTVSLVGLTGVLAFLTIALHTAYTKMDMMLSYLKHCPFIMSRAFLRDGGPWGRLLILGAIVGVLKTPGLYVPDGSVSIEDVLNFPRELKAKLIALYRFGNWFTLIFMLCGLYSYADWSTMAPARLGAVLLVIAAVPIWIALCLSFVARHADTIIGNFVGSSAINFRGRLTTGGRFENFLFIVSVSVIVTCGRIFVRRGTVDLNELDKFTGPLRIKLLCLFWAGCALVLSLFLLYFIPR